MPGQSYYRAGICRGLSKESRAIWWLTANVLRFLFCFVQVLKEKLVLVSLTFYIYLWWNWLENCAKSLWYLSRHSVRKSGHNQHCRILEIFFFVCLSMSSPVPQSSVWLQFPQSSPGPLRFSFSISSSRASITGGLWCGVHSHWSMETMLLLCTHLYYLI